MSPLARMRISRDKWKEVAVSRATANREMKKKNLRQQARIEVLEGKIAQVKDSIDKLKKKIRW